MTVLAVQNSDRRRQEFQTAGSAGLDAQGRNKFQTDSPASRHEAAEQRVAGLKREFGDDDPNTLTAMLDLAEITFNQGRLIATRKLEEAVVAGRTKLLGENHPETLRAMRKLGVTLGAQGELVAARELQQRVVTEMRALWGDENFETLRAVNNLAGTLAAAGGLATGVCETIVTSCRVLGDQRGR